MCVDKVRVQFVWYNSDWILEQPRTVAEFAIPVSSCHYPGGGITKFQTKPPVRLPDVGCVMGTTNPAVSYLSASDGHTNILDVY